MSNYNTTLQSNNTDLQAILNTINELPEANGDPVLQDKTVTPTTSQQTITADNGYDGLDTVTVNAMPTATQATPSITVNASGLITATATQTAGYVSAGTKSATKQLAFQAAKTITPTTTNQTAVSSGYYTGGAVTVKGDSNLIAGNIKSGVSIFGVNGTYVGSGGGGTENEDGLISGNLTTYTNERVSAIAAYAFYYCTNITSVNFPACTSIYDNAFYGCSRLTTISFPACTTIGSYAFYYCTNITSANFPVCTSIYQSAFFGCSRLTTVSFPACTTIDLRAFYGCSSLTTASFPACTTIDQEAFYKCSSLTTVSFPACTTIKSKAFYSCSKLNTIILTGSSLCSLVASNAFSGTSIWSTKGSIFVPASLVASYKAATNWAFFSNRIYGV